MYNNEFYQNLTKPVLNPPSSVFKIVWPVLYLLMFISLLLVIKSESSLKTWAVWIFVIQLFLNICWSPVFFVLKQIRTALLISIILTMTVLFMIMIFYAISPIAGIIQIPYFLWLCFATFLNLEFIRLNPFIEG